MSSTTSHYQTLEISETATHEEITKSYRRLALVHHPDKNDGDQESTARFQSISAAYETLKDANLRERYDHTLRAPQGRGTASSYNDRYGGPPSFSDLFPGMMFRGPGGMPFFFFEDDEEFTEAEYRAYKAQQAEEADWYRARRDAAKAAYKAEQDEKAAKEAEEKAKQEAKKAEKEAEILRKAKEFETMRENELATMQKIWNDANAVTTAEKQGLCKHSQRWIPQKLKAKLKCPCCRKKGGIQAFKCPYCEVLACQLCQQKFAKDLKA